MAKVLYYCLLLPLSKLPLSVLYGVGRCLYWLAYRVFGYRKQVVWENIRGSFPTWSEREVEAQADKFYRYFFDTIAESVKLFSISIEESILRCSVSNPEILDAHADAGRGILAVGAHYSNWEIAGLSFPEIFPRHAIMAVYSPLKNPAMDALMRGNRERNGTKLISRRVINDYYANDPPSPSVDFFVADQSPSNHLWQKIHWTNFLNRPTGFLAGPERFAVRNDIPIFYMALRMVGRGRYVGELIPITDTPTRTKPGEITEAYARILEREIIANPTPWLWTHRRWKRPAPPEVVELLKDRPYVAPEYTVNGSSGED